MCYYNPTIQNVSLSKQQSIVLLSMGVKKNVQEMITTAF